MKKLIITTAIAIASACISALAQDSPQDFTAKITNPSFEENGLNGWSNSGFQSQNNESPADVGWEKDGSVYAEKWVSSPNSCGYAYISQIVSDLPNGEYKLRIVGHSINQSGTPELTKGTYVVAGNNRTNVPAFGEYEVSATVAEGFLEIGFLAENPDANWVAVDNFRLYRTGENIDAYRAYLADVVAELQAALDAPNCPANYNKDEVDAALAAAQAAQTKEEILAAIPQVRTATKNFISVKRNYGRLRSVINITNDLINNSDYPGKDALIEAVAQAQAVLDNPSSTGTNLGNAVDLLKSASAEYLANRPEEWVTITNGAMWRDTDGKHVQAHGAGFLQVNDTWYMIGEDRSGPYNPDVNMYSSKDLVNWKFERKIIQNRVTHPSLGNGRMIERPKLMYCDATGQFVVWCHWEASNYGASEAGVFYADKVNDPYTYYWGGRPQGVKSRDCNVFIDDDGTAYFISTTEENTNLGLFRLSEDYLDAEDCVTLFRGQRREAPAIVKVDDVYYMLSSACSGWDPNQCKLATSKSLSSGWSGLKNLGNSIAFDTQPASILTIKGTKATTHLFVGDRWQDPSLTESKTIIFPVVFADNGCVYEYRERFDINFVTGEWRETPSEGSQIVDKSGWSILSCSSEETVKEQGGAANAIDGDKGTKWHTQYSSPAGVAPHHIAVDMGKQQTISGFIAAPRTDNSTNGLVREFAFHVSDDGENWQMVSGGSWLGYNAMTCFEPVSARYFKFTALSGGYAALSEIDVVSGTEYVPCGEFNPYYKIDDGSWKKGTEIEIDADHKLTLGPSVNGWAGSWAIECPDTIASGREYSYQYMGQPQAGTYRVFYVDMYNMTHTMEYHVTVNGESGIDDVFHAEEPIIVRYYNLAGVEVPEHALGQGLYIKCEYFNNSRPKITKVIR